MISGENHLWQPRNTALLQLVASWGSNFISTQKKTQHQTSNPFHPALSEFISWNTPHKDPHGWDWANLPLPWEPLGSFTTPKSFWMERGCQGVPGTPHPLCLYSHHCSLQPALKMHSEFYLSLAWFLAGTQFISPCQKICGKTEWVKSSRIIPKWPCGSSLGGRGESRNEVTQQFRGWMWFLSQTGTALSCPFLPQKIPKVPPSGSAQILHLPSALQDPYFAPSYFCFY